MKYLIFLSIVFFAGCAASNETQEVSVRPSSQSSDTIEYELIISDSAFDQWFAVNQQPVDFYSEEFYEDRNQQYVIQYNSLVDTTSGDPSSPFNQRIAYLRNVDYPLQLDYKLYYYFKYVEDIYGHLFNFPA
ncbi:MAG: DUF6146 family protein [Candidatus Cyclobacteriaceae bacterium M3_2C_046]